MAEAAPKPILTVGFGLSTFLSALGTDGSLPAMVAIASAFETDVSRIQFTLAAFFFGGTVGQAFSGPLADRLGRRPTLLASTLLYVASALLSVFALDVTMLIVLRFFQGAGATSGRVVVRAIVRDLYSREMAARTLSMMTVVGTCIPIFAPLTTAQLLLHFGWRAVFLFMAAFSFVLFVLLWHYVEESLAEKDVHAIKPFTMLLNFIQIAKNRTFLIYGFFAIAPNSGLTPFLTGAAAVLIGTRGLRPDEFSLAFACVMIANTVAAYTNARLVVRFGFATMMRTGTIICALAGVTELVLAMLNVEAIAAVIGPMMAWMFGMAFVNATATAGALVPFPERAGVASALLGIVQGLLATGVSALIGVLPHGSAVAMASITALSGLLLVGVYFATRREIAADG